MPVVGAGELEHLVAPGGRALGRSALIVASVPDEVMRSMSTASMRARRSRARPRRRRRRAEGGSARGRIGDGLDHLGMGMAVDQRSPGADVVDVSVAVDVGDLRAFGTVDEQRVAPDQAHRPHRRVDAARKQQLRPPVQLGGADVRQGGGQARSSSQRRKSSVK